MNGDHTIMVEILNAIEHGNLSVHETRRRLERLIDQEIEKTDAPANMQLVEECEKLLWELNTNGTMPYVSHREENLAAVRAQAGKQRKRDILRKNALRVGIAVAAMFILMISAEVFLRREWIGVRSTTDEQQRVVEGEAVDHGVMQEGVASEGGQEYRSINTTSLEEAVDFLGIDFHIPENPEGDWVLSYVECTKTKRRINLLSFFTHSSDPQRKLTISAYQFSEVEDAYLTLEQSKTGSTEELNGVELYLAINNERMQCTWMVDTCVYTIGGHLKNTEVLKIANQIIGEK